MFVEKCEKTRKAVLACDLICKARRRRRRAALLHAAAKIALGRDSR
jgi:hypothetical protein